MQFYDEQDDGAIALLRDAGNRKQLLREHEDGSK